MGNEPAKEEVCIEGSNVYKVGETWSDPGQCNQKTCRPGGAIVTKECLEVMLPNGCSLQQGNMDAPYPQCCPTAYCPMGQQEDNVNKVLEGLLEAASSSSSSSSSSSEDDPLEEFYEIQEGDENLEELQKQQFSRQKLTLAERRSEQAMKDATRHGVNNNTAFGRNGKAITNAEENNWSNNDVEVEGKTSENALKGNVDRLEPSRRERESQLDRNNATHASEEERAIDDDGYESYTGHPPPAVDSEEDQALKAFLDRAGNRVYKTESNDIDWEKIDDDEEYTASLLGHDETFVNAAKEFSVSKKSLRHYTEDRRENSLKRLVYDERILDHRSDEMLLEMIRAKQSLRAQSKETQAKNIKEEIASNSSTNMTENNSFKDAATKNLIEDNSFKDAETKILIEDNSFKDAETKISYKNDDLDPLRYEETSEFIHITPNSIYRSSKESEINNTNIPQHNHEGSTEMHELSITDGAPNTDIFLPNDDNKEELNQMNEGATNLTGNCQEGEIKEIAKDIFEPDRTRLISENSLHEFKPIDLNETENSGSTSDTTTDYSVLTNLANDTNGQMDSIENVEDVLPAEIDFKELIENDVDAVNEDKLACSENVQEVVGHTSDLIGEPVAAEDTVDHSNVLQDSEVTNEENTRQEESAGAEKSEETVIFNG